MTPQDAAQTFMELGEHYQVLASWAKGIRVQLEADGWSATQAERIAADVLIETYRKAMR